MLVKNKLFILIAAFLFSSVSSADYLLSPSVTYLKQSVNDGSAPEAKAQMTLLDFRFGYQFEFGLYLGGLYSIHNNELLTKASDSYFGPSLGYIYENIMLITTFMVYGERDMSSGNTKYSDAKGLQVDLTYKVPVNDLVSVGPQITYHSIEFSDAQVAGISSSATYRWQGFTPYFNLTVQFK